MDLGPAPSPESIRAAILKVRTDPSFKAAAEPASDAQKPVGIAELAARLAG
jgi:hypothetical protein